MWKQARAGIAFPPRSCCGKCQMSVVTCEKLKSGAGRAGRQKTTLCFEEETLERKRNTRLNRYCREERVADLGSSLWELGGQVEGEKRTNSTVCLQLWWRFLSCFGGRAVSSLCVVDVSTGFAYFVFRLSSFLHVYYSSKRSRSVERVTIENRVRPQRSEPELYCVPRINATDLRFVSRRARVGLYNPAKMV